MPIHFDSGVPASWTKPVFLSDEVYGQVLQSKVINCIDLLPVLVEDGRVKVLLGLRDQEPMSDWWVFGGAQAIRNAPTESLAKRIKAELGIEFDPARFTFLDAASMPWPTREQEPQDAGCHMSSWFYAVELAPEELDRITFNEEYADTKTVDADEVLDGDYHPVVKHMVRKFLELRDERFRAVAFHNREADRVTLLLMQGGLDPDTATAAIQAAGIPALAQCAFELVRDARSSLDDREICGALAAATYDRPSTPAAQKYLRERGITPPPSNLSPKDFFATLEAAKKILG